MSTLDDLEYELNRVEHLLSKGLWDSDQHREKLRKQHIYLLDRVDEIRDNLAEWRHSNDG